MIQTPQGNERYAAVQARLPALSLGSAPGCLPIEYDPCRGSSRETHTMQDEITAVLRLDAVEAAPLVLGLELVVGGCSGRIVEVEAYRQDDPASHSFRGLTPRNAPMFLWGGHLYVYRSYGVHWCMNLVTGKEGDGQALLIRALEPLRGVAAMRRRRGEVSDLRLCSGPGNVCQALGVDGSLSGEALGGRVRLCGHPGTATAVLTTPRVGITQGTDLPWRFCLADSRFLSRHPRGGTGTDGSVRRPGLRR